jgi:DNA-directed RNA polymerase sigma subunit (sigma70/sigma32)
MDVAQAITSALQHLDEHDRRILELRYGLQGTPLDAAEVAKTVGTTVDEVWTSEAYALETLSFLLLTTNDIAPAFRRAA